MFWFILSVMQSFSVYCVWYLHIHFLQAFYWKICQDGEVGVTCLEKNMTLWYNTEPNYSIFWLLPYHLYINFCLKNKCRPHRFQLYLIKILEGSLHCHRLQCCRGREANSIEIEVCPKKGWYVGINSNFCGAV